MFPTGLYLILTAVVHPCIWSGQLHRPDRVYAVQRGREMGKRGRNGKWTVV